jgi:hypothetical protein
MLYQGKDIGRSDEPILAAARWLLDNRAAWLDETVVTYRRRDSLYVGESWRDGQVAGSRDLSICHSDHL